MSADTAASSSTGGVVVVRAFDAAVVAVFFAGALAGAVFLPVPDFAVAASTAGTFARGARAGVARLGVAAAGFSETGVAVEVSSGAPSVFVAVPAALVRDDAVVG
ncbi:hypothetical protein [Pseudoclavibacter terrae]|uniref:hypothetical protein n=1 Tax=Pseudoclavibacter terrae TaxID=1530195 RepID=UPI00142ED72D|nr:hypothetical protein [Pseudoclavibacter terrae]